MRPSEAPHRLSQGAGQQGRSCISQHPLSAPSGCRCSLQRWALVCPPPPPRAPRRSPISTPSVLAQALTPALWENRLVLDRLRLVQRSHSLQVLVPVPRQCAAQEGGDAGLPEY